MDIGRALIVDDSKVVQFKLKRMLEARGLGVDTASSGHEALDFLKSNAPDVIFMDFMMPDMDGYEVTGMITANPVTASIPVVMCTGHDTPQDRAAGEGERRQRLRHQAGRRLGARQRCSRNCSERAPSEPTVAVAEADDVAEEDYEATIVSPTAGRQSAADYRLAPRCASSPPMPLSGPVREPRFRSPRTRRSRRRRWRCAPAHEDVARIAERVAREVAEKLVREAIAALTAASEQVSRTAAQEVAARATQDALGVAARGIGDDPRARRARGRRRGHARGSRIGPARGRGRGSRAQVGSDGSRRQAARSSRRRPCDGRARGAADGRFGQVDDGGGVAPDPRVGARRAAGRRPQCRRDCREARRRNGGAGGGRAARARHAGRGARGRNGHAGGSASRRPSPSRNGLRARRSSRPSTRPRRRANWP